MLGLTSSAWTLWRRGALSRQGTGRFVSRKKAHLWRPKVAWTMHKYAQCLACSGLLGSLSSGFPPTHEPWSSRIVGTRPALVADLCLNLSCDISGRPSIGRTPDVFWDSSERLAYATRSRFANTSPGICNSAKGRFKLPCQSPLMGMLWSGGDSRVCVTMKTANT